ncbi:hypothetical protein EXIGLDRAFT_747917 [Exidia glandulosa HHB12029]|uniref:Uncharacterized protein n=1 Tax=Exidia glandulosa HHB12029 TaxID=1314781 RepID=A0A165K8W7_EXIGL|nr:hypothetical protein EXIGLDRAFT_747917 [Exidia glandulosa HHB12029]
MSLLDLHIDHIVRLHQNTQPFVSNIQHQRLDRPTIDAQVKAAIAACPDTSATHWEIFLRHELVEVAANEGDAVQRNASAYYDALCNMLDFILTATEHGVCDDVVIWAALEDLLRVQTVETCSHIFSWIEARAARLTVVRSRPVATALSSLTWS